MHELHSLSAAVLDPVRASENRWQPKAGLSLRPVPSAPAPADSGKQRQFQIRALSREFSARSVDYDFHTWELRLRRPRPRHLLFEIGYRDANAGMSRLRVLGAATSCA